ncbi:MAG: PepSY domain-containing protein [Pelagimonas sp.]|jgi:hypothetical protein|nr:PepSY domain-containing protein [Pelagimonas sp.]
MSRFSTASALALLVGAAPAFADVTPQQVWDDLETYMQKFGYEVTATEAMSGSTLTVSDISMSMSFPEDAGAFEVTASEMSFTDQGDGTVLVDLPANLPMTMKGVEDGDDMLDMVMTIGQTGMRMVVSGEPNNLTYSYSADEMSVTIDELTAEGETLSGDDFTFTYALGMMSGVSTVTRDAKMQKVVQDMQALTGSLMLKAKDPDSGDNIDFTGNYKSLVMNGETTIPMNADMSDPANILASGLGGYAHLAHGGSELNFAVTGDEPVSGTMTSTSGKIDVGFSEDGISYDVGGTGTNMTVQGPMPFPVSMAMEESGFTLVLPTKAGAGEQDAKLSMLFKGFTMDDMLWMLVDGGNVLPRDPATISLDLDAKVTPLLNIFDTQAMEEFEATAGSDELPAEINSLKLSNLLVEAVGAKIAGDGAFTFDNSDLETFDGMPRPTGKVNLSAEGVNGLLDKLIEMGIMSQQDAGGMRMMMAMFTVPGDAEDTMTSVLEINDQGHVLANGQRLQ